MVRPKLTSRAATGFAFASAASLVSLAACMSALGAGCGGTDYADADDASAPTGDGAPPDGTTGRDSGTDTATPDGSDGAADTGADGAGDTGTDSTTDTGADGAGDGATTDGSDGGGDGASDAGLDVNLDAALDARLDAGLDASVDASLDASLDVNIDVGVDASLDGALDANLDAGIDATLPIDASVDASVDASLDASVDAALDAAFLQNPLGTAAAFAILAGNSVSNVGLTTTVLGDVGVSPGTNIATFPFGQPVGDVHAGDAVAALAQTDLTAAFNFFATRPCSPLNDRSGVDLGGKSLPPGTYCFTGSAAISGALLLDGQGNPAAQWIFQVSSSLTTTALSSVTLINFGNPCNVFWAVGSTVNIGAATTFRGNVLSGGNITLGTAAGLAPGRALSRTGIVTLDSNGIAKAVCQ